MTDSAYFVISTPLTAFVGTFQNFAYILSCPLEFDAEKKSFLQNGRFMATAPN